MPVKTAVEVCKQADIKTHIGRIVSGDQFVADSKAESTIQNAFGGLCTEMEGATIAQVAYLNDVPFVIVRAISDKADGSAGIDFV